MKRTVIGAIWFISVGIFDMATDIDWMTYVWFGTGLAFLLVHLIQLSFTKKEQS